MKYRFLALFLLIVLLPTSVWGGIKLLPEQADSLEAKGREYYAQFRYMDALDMYDQAIEVANATHNEGAALRSLMSIGNIHIIFDNYEQALHYYQLCHERAEAQASSSAIGSSLYNMLLCHAMLGNAELAQQCYDQMEGVEVGDAKVSRFYHFSSQGLLAQARGDARAAIFFHRQALEYARNHGMDPLYEAAQVGRIGTLEEQLGNLDEAIACYLQSADVARRNQSLATLCTSYERLSSLYRQLHNDTASMRYQRLYVQLEDSLFSTRDFTNSSGRLMKSEMRQHSQLISALSDQVSMQLTVILVFVVMLLALAALIIIIYRQNRHLVQTQRLLIAKHREMDLQRQQQSRLGEEYLRVVGGVEPVLPAEAAGPSLSASNADSGEDDEMVSSGSVPLLNAQQTEVLLAAIVQVLEDRNAICDPAFSLQSLATRVGSNTRYVSWAINASYGKTFKTLLNEYRIREAARRLTDRQHYGHLTIAAIAEQLGYKSPTSFNTAFKRIFGMTPAAYQRLADTSN